MIFVPTNPERIAAKQLQDARRMLLEHQAAAEYHQAMADMARKQVARLSAEAMQVSQ